jgi:hypothetical protein
MMVPPSGPPLVDVEALLDDAEELLDDVEVDEPPVAVEEPPVDVEEPPVAVEEPPVDVEEPPVDADAPPVAADELPVPAEELLLPADPVPLLLEHASAETTSTSDMQRVEWYARGNIAKVMRVPPVAPLIDRGASARDRYFLPSVRGLELSVLERSVFQLVPNVSRFG